jgi:hypothetical protein
VLRVLEGDARGVAQGLGFDPQRHRRIVALVGRCLASTRKMKWFCAGGTSRAVTGALRGMGGGPLVEAEVPQDVEIDPTLTTRVRHRQLLLSIGRGGSTRL